MEKVLKDFQKLAQSLLKNEKEHPVAPYIPSDELFHQMDLSLKENGIEDEALFTQLSKLIESSTKIASTSFFNQLYGGRSEKAVLGDLLAVLLNNSMYTYKAAGVQIGVEKEVLRKVQSIVGWTEEGGGAFAPGGSLTNFMSMVMARDAVRQQSRFQGVRQQLTVYTSEESHYSIPKNAAMAGLGRDNVRYIPVNEKGEMLVEKLEEAIQKDIAIGNIPVLINATAGTTVLGAIDAVDEIQKISNQYKIWLHVDGAYLGSVIFSEKYKHLLKGIEKADSFSFNAHKMLNTPTNCSIIVTRHKKHLYNSFSSEADYLFQTEADEFNPGKTSLQCGRRNDALKLWTLWKSVGTKGLGEMVEHEFELANAAREYVANHPDYTLYSFENSLSVCFNYKGIPPKELAESLYKENKLLVSHGSFNGQTFIRFVTINHQHTKEDVLRFFNELETFSLSNFCSVKELQFEKG